MRMKVRQAGIIFFFTVLSFVIAVLLWGAYTSQITAFIVTQSLKLKVLLPTGIRFDLLKGDISLNLIAIIENKALTEIEIDGGEYTVYLSAGWHEYPLLHGEIREMYVAANSFREVPLTARVSIAKLPDTLKSIISERSTNINIRVEIILQVPVKFLGIKVWTNNVKLTQYASH